MRERRRTQVHVGHHRQFPGEKDCSGFIVVGRRSVRAAAPL